MPNTLRLLVERHLRLCLGASYGFESLRTAAGSEPFVAKAATELIRGSGSTSVEHLGYHEYLRCIDCDGRGVLPASLLVMQARDIVYWKYGFPFMTRKSREWIYLAAPKRVQSLGLHTGSMPPSR